MTDPNRELDTAACLALPTMAGCKGLKVVGSLVVRVKGIDLPVINGAGDKLSDGTRGLGGLLRAWQAGRIQQYMVIALLLTVIAGAILLFVFTQA